MSYFFFAFHTFTLKVCIWLVNEFETSTNQINHILIIGFPPLKPFLFVCIFMLISIFFTTMDIPVFCDHASWHLSSRYCSNAHDRDRLNPRDHDPWLSFFTERKPEEQSWPDTTENRTPYLPLTAWNTSSLPPIHNYFLSLKWILKRASAFQLSISIDHCPLKLTCLKSKRENLVITTEIRHLLNFQCPKRKHRFRR